MRFDAVVERDVDGGTAVDVAGAAVGWVAVEVTVGEVLDGWGRESGGASQTVRVELSTLRMWSYWGPGMRAQSISLRMFGRFCMSSWQI